MAYQKSTAMSVWSCNSPIVSHIQALTHKIAISDSRAAVQYLEHPYTTCSFRVECKHTQNVILERGCDACLDP